MCLTHGSYVVGGMKTGIKDGTIEGSADTRAGIHGVKDERQREEGGERNGAVDLQNEERIIDSLWP